MPLSDLQTLRRSELVRKVLSVQFDGIGEMYRLKAKVELSNGWLMQIWEHKTRDLRRYAYHVYKGERMIVRWDNAPHHPHVKTFPHHKHQAGRILESGEVGLAEVLQELRKLLSERKRTRTQAS